MGVDWAGVIEKAVAALTEARTTGYANGAFTMEDSVHRRGRGFLAIACGVSFGGGQKVFH